MDWEPGVLCQITVSANTMMMYFNILSYAAQTLLKHLAEMALYINSVVTRGTAGPKLLVLLWNSIYNI